MELRHLRYFVTAAETENVSRAAMKLHVSQPALSRQIRDLEQELGFALFERSAKSVRLTEAGKTFVNEAREVLKRAEEAVDRARAIASAGASQLQVGYAPSPLARIIPATLRSFREQFPKVRVRLHDLSTQEMLTGVRDGELEIAFLVRPNAKMLRGLIFEELSQDTMCVAVAPNHRLAELRSVTVADAARETLVIFNRSEYPEYYGYLEHLFERVKTKPRVAEEHDSSASLITAIESGTGVAIVPESFSCSSGPRLKLVPLLASAAEPIRIGAVWPKSGAKGMAEKFWNTAKEAVSKLDREKARG
jgi:DNA-binding transcriptional LysR family regulator